MVWWIGPIRLKTAQAEGSGSPLPSSISHSQVWMGKSPLGTGMCCGWARDGGERVQTVSMSDSGDPPCLPERCVPWTAMPELGSSVVVSANHEMLSHFPLNSSCDRVIVWPALK